MTMWIIQGTAVKRTPQGETTRQIPTFYLNSNIQGIVSADTCEKVAKDVVDPFGELEVHLCVQTVFE